MWSQVKKDTRTKLCVLKWNRQAMLSSSALNCCITHLTQNVLFCEFCKGDDVLQNEWFLLTPRQGYATCQFIRGEQFSVRFNHQVCYFDIRLFKTFCNFKIIMYFNNPHFLICTKWIHQNKLNSDISKKSTMFRLLVQLLCIRQN